MIDIGIFSIVRFTAQLPNTMTKMNFDKFAYYVVYRILMKTINISIVYMICTITAYRQQTVLSQCIKRTLLIIGMIICIITIISLIIFTYLIIEIFVRQNIIGSLSKNRFSMFDEKIQFKSLDANSENRFLVYQEDIL